jgi:hypothetical protein
VARPRGTPKTPFGAWLGQWLDEHPELTLEAFGDRVAKAVGRRAPLTDGAISQWLSGKVRRIGADNLRGVSIVTGEPYENLERLVYGGATSTPGMPTAPPEWAEHMQGQIEGLRAILERSPYAEQRRLAAEISAIYQAQDPATTSRRRAYWLQMARRNTLKLTDRALAKKPGSRSTRFGRGSARVPRSPPICTPVSRMPTSSRCR